MKVAIEVNDRKEADQVKTAMDEPIVRAYVLVMGVLLQLPDDRSRKDVLAAVNLLIYKDKPSPAKNLGITHYNDDPGSTVFACGEQKARSNQNTWSTLYDDITCEACKDSAAKNRVNSLEKT